MLTVILAEKELLKKFQKYSLFFKPLLDDKEIAFCKMNPAASSIEEAVPDLHGIINNCDTWKAVIIAQGSNNKLNPFDFTGYTETLQLSRKRTISWDLFSQYLKNRQAAYEKAIENPLTKLSFAFGADHRPVSDAAFDEYEAVVSGELPLYKLMVNRRLESMNISKAVTWIRKYGNAELEEFFGSKEEFNDFLSAVEEKDADRIIEIIGPENVPFFAQHIEEDDPYCSDPYLIVSQLDEISKEKQLKKLRADFTFLDVKPREIVFISERCCDLPYERLNSKDNTDDFAEFNLYSSNIFYLLFDILPESHRQHEQDSIRYLTFILTVAKKGFPRCNVHAGELYYSDVSIDRDKFFEICSAYDAKLAATRREIARKINECGQSDSSPLDNVEVRELFESDIHIKVSDTTEFEKSSMRADYKGIGLATDCPEDEMSKWTSQYKNIEKTFLRYLREPKRIVKTAAKTEFVERNTINDDRMRRLNEFQKEDILFRLQEEEKNMVDTRTADLFRSDSYVEKLRKSSDDIKKVIRGRMTRKTTVLIGISAGAAFLLGFLPMIFSNLNDLRSFATSAGIILAGLAIFLTAGFITLFSLRKKLRSRFFSFNMTIGGIFSDIADGLRGFSEYLSHACNVMRENSILDVCDEEFSSKVRILKKHLLDIDRKREELRSIYSGYFEINGDAYLNAEPFDYDFTELRLYDYDADVPAAGDNVEYIEPGKHVSIPVDYLNSIMLTKEKDHE